MNKPIDGQDAYPEPVAAEFVRPVTVEAQTEIEQLREECNRWRERAIRAMRDRDAAQKEANRYAADLMESNGELAQLDAARAQVHHLREALGKCVVEFEGVARPGRLNVSKSDAANAKMTIQQARDALRDTEAHGETEPQP